MSPDGQPQHWPWSRLILLQNSGGLVVKRMNEGNWKLTLWQCSEPHIIPPIFHLSIINKINAGVHEFSYCIFLLQEVEARLQLCVIPVHRVVLISSLKAQSMSECAWIATKQGQQLYYETSVGLTMQECKDAGMNVYSAAKHSNSTCKHHSKWSTHLYRKQ